MLLHRYSRQNDILVGSPVACRSQPGFENVVGYLLNMVVLRGDLSGNPTFAEFLRQVRDTVLAALRHQDYPFSMLVERLQPIRDPSRPPIFQAAFLMEKSHRLAAQGAASLMMGQAGSQLEVGGLALEPFGLRAEATPFEIALIVEDAGSSFAGCFQYNADLFDAATIDRLADTYQRLLEAFVANPGRRIDEAPLLSAGERTRLLVDRNAGTMTHRAPCTHGQRSLSGRHRVPRVDCPAGRAHARPHRRGRRRSADDLWRAGPSRQPIGALSPRPRRGARIAGHALAGGVCLDRSCDMLVGLLGILKAGAAYVPVDPAFPRERIRLYPRP